LTREWKVALVTPLDIFGMAALYAPFLAIGLIFAHSRLRRAVWKRNKRLLRPNLGYCPSIVRMGTAFQHLQVFYRPTMAYVLEAKQDEEDVDEDDNGDPETPLAHFSRQLRRIRRGERVDTLVLRL
jgi:hypothetical protein